MTKERVVSREQGEQLAKVLSEFLAYTDLGMLLIVIENFVQVYNVM